MNDLDNDRWHVGFNAALDLRQASYREAARTLHKELKAVHDTAHNRFMESVKKADAVFAEQELALFAEICRSIPGNETMTDQQVIQEMKTNLLFHNRWSSL
jgi:hypothetical protein